MRFRVGICNSLEEFAIKIEETVSSHRVDKGVLTITIQKLDLSKEEDEIRVTID